MQFPWRSGAIVERGVESANRQVLSLPEEVLGRRDLQWEFQRAWEIQRDLLPKRIPRLPGCQISGRCRPAEAVGGDYFDILKFTGRKIALCIADAAGKGMPAALLMANLRAGVRSWASESLPPREFCEKVNRLVFSTVAPGNFITLFYCLLDTGHGTLVYTSAGHNPPILLRRDDSVLRLEEGGAALGIQKDSSYQQGEVELASGDWLLLFTDGLTEARNADHEQFGEERLLGLLAANRDLGAAELPGKLIEAVVDFGGGCLHDDTTLVVVSVE